MPLKDHLDNYKGIETVWGKIIPEKEAYKLGLRQIAAFSANLFQVMRILEPDYEARTTAICEIANLMNMSVAGTPDDQADYINAFKDEWNIPEFCQQSSWLGGLIGDYGDEYGNMAGRVIQFTPNRVEKELDTCPWDIVGSEMCNMTTAMFTANFDLNNANGVANEVALNMCEARGCGDMHCRVVAERRDVYDLEEQGWLDHMNQPVDPVHPTPRERMVTEGQCLRNGKYTNVFGEEKSLEFCYRWAMENGWTWSVNFPICAVRDMADSEEDFERIFRIVFSTAGKNAFIDPFAIEGMRSWLGVPREIGWNDGRLMGGYVKAMLDIQMVPNELEVFDEEETRITVVTDDFVGRFPMAPIDELVIGYEALWHNMVKTMVSPEWSCWIEGTDEERMAIVIGHRIDKRMI
jgi:hypothetical protein